MNISPATQEHACGIARVHVRSWQAAYTGILDQAFLDGLSIEDRAKRWEEILLKADSRTLVAHRDEDVVGFVSYGRCRDDGAEANQGEIWAIYVEPESWRQGGGRGLMNQALKDLRAAGCTDVCVWVLSRNDRAVGFYKSIGFSRVEGSEREIELGGRPVEEVCLRRQDDV